MQRRSRRSRPISRLRRWARENPDHVTPWVLGFWGVLISAGATYFILSRFR